MPDFHQNICFKEKCVEITVIYVEFDIKMKSFVLEGFYSESRVAIFPYPDWRKKLVILKTNVFVLCILYPGSEVVL